MPSSGNMADTTGSHVLADTKLMSRAAKQLLQLRHVYMRRQKTKNDIEVPLVFRETGILSGYRVPEESWFYYLTSFFHLHNESGNVWSHFLAAFIYVYKLHDLCVTEDITSEPLTWPLIGFTLNIIVYAVLSTFAHLFQSKSPLVHYTCFQIDYIGIGLNSFGTGLLLYYTTGSKAYYAIMGPNMFMTVNTLMAIMVCVTCSIAKLRYSRPYPADRKLWQFMSTGSHVLFSVIPLICFCWQCSQDTRCTIYDALIHLHPFIWFFASLFFFASHLPEKWFPGRFDLVGHGHQIFHVLMIATSVLQLDAGISQIHSRPRHLVAMSMPDAMVIFGSIATMIVVCCVFVVFTHPYRVRKVRKDAELELIYNEKAQ